MSKHTPGPWYAHAVTWEDEDVIHWTHLVALDDEPELASLEAGRNVALFMSGDDAALIAAAPDLLAACKMAFEDRCLKRDDGSCWIDQRDKVAMTLQAAMAKAGGTP